MTLIANLCVSLAFLLSIFIISQLICLAMRMHNSMVLNRRRCLRDRQGATFEVSEEQSRNRYGDIFFIEPSGTDAARIRDDLEKDDRDLPSYDEVMRMCNLSTPTAAPAVSGSNSDPPPLAPVSIAALPAPPYTVADTVSSYTPVDSSTVSRHTTAIQMEPSTSRVHQTPPSASMVMSLPHTTSNTDV